MTVLRNRARVAGLAAALAAVTLLAAPGFARADAVRDWNLNATTALAAQDARVAVLHLAMVHGAVYDAVNAIDRGHRPYLSRRARSPGIRPMRLRRLRHIACSSESCPSRSRPSKRSMHRRWPPSPTVR